MKKFLFVVGAIFLLSGCDQVQVQKNQQIKQPEITRDTQQTGVTLQVSPHATLQMTQETVQPGIASLAPNHFTLKNLKVGQKYGGMTVEKISPFRAEDPISDDYLRVDFSGTVTLKGKLRAPTNDPNDGGMGPDYSLDSLTPDSLAKVPFDDGRDVWFGITNPELMKNAGVKNRDMVELTINHYHYVGFPGEVWNEAEMVSIKKSQ